jgi:DNA repair protein RecO (recombination protein O)
MAGRQTYRTEAIVLHTLDYGESDRICRFYTDQFGKVSGIAKGARKSRKRFPNALEPCCRSMMIFSRRGRSELVLVESCDVLEHYDGIRGDLESSLVASYFLELIEQFTLEGKRSVELYSHLASFLGLVNSGLKADGIIRLFELRMLKLLGYDPFLDRCIQCRRPLEESARSAFRFNYRDGAIRCGDCAPGVNGTPGPSEALLSPGTLKTLLIGKQCNVDFLQRLVFTDNAQRESRIVLTRFIQFLLGKELKSFNILNEIRMLSG